MNEPLEPPDRAITNGNYHDSTTATEEIDTKEASSNSHEGGHQLEHSNENEEAPKQALQYLPLDLRAKQIRLLRILDEDSGHHVHCSLEKASLVDPGLPQYTALSYCWGAPDVTTVMVVDKCQIEVTKNLEAALRQLRYRGYRCVWIDALCVNQTDREERGLQVQLMQHVYSHAEQVIAWVGYAEDDTAGAVKFLLERSSASLALPESTFKEASPTRNRTPSNERGIHDHGGVLDSPRYSRLEKAQKKWIRNQWSIIQDFFNQDYWKRVWVIQEVAVATHLKVLYGVSEISWDNVAAAIILWKKTLLALPTSHLSHLYAAQLLDLRNRFIEQTPISLLHAMLMSNKALATDPRDKIFALLGITFDGPGLVPTPNYEKPLKDILSDLTRAMILSEGCLDIICLRSIYPPTDSTMPSWIPPIFNNQKFSLWSKPITILENRLLTERPRFPGGLSTFQTINRNVISVEAVILDFVCVLSSVSGHKTNPLLADCHLEQCLPQHQHTLETNIGKLYPSGPTNSLWQSLCAEHTFHPFKPAGKYYNRHEVAKFRSCFAALWTEQSRISAGRELREWLDENKSMEIGSLPLSQWAWASGAHTAADLHAFCRVLTDVLQSSMRLFVTSFGYLGLAPSQTRRGDRICFLKGCSVPVILRGNSKLGYKVIGCCFLRSRFEPYAEACGRFAVGKAQVDGVPGLNVKRVVLL